MTTSDAIYNDSLMISEQIILRQLSIADAVAYRQLYELPLVQRFFEASAFGEDESDEAFTVRISNACQYAWTIRKSESPDVIIGDCALHHGNENAGQVETGFVLHPDHWGEGIMTRTLSRVICFAGEVLEVREVVANTSKFNDNAARLLERLSFEKTGSEGLNTCYRKIISR